MFFRTRTLPRDRLILRDDKSDIVNERFRKRLVRQVSRRDQLGQKTARNRVRIALKHELSAQDANNGPLAEKVLLAILHRVPELFIEHGNAADGRVNGNAGLFGREIRTRRMHGIQNLRNAFGIERNFLCGDLRFLRRTQSP